MDLSPKTVKQSVKTLFCLPKPSTVLVPADERVELIISVKKIPKLSKISVGRFVLPHSLYSEESSVCLFVKDKGGPKNRDFDEVKQTYLKKLKKAGINEVKEVIPLRQLRLEFKPFEAKRNLSNAFDGYLGDERIFNYLRTLLGKHFYSRHRSPISVKLTTDDLAKAVGKALRTSYTTITKRGPSSMVPVGTINVNSEDDIAENILAVWEQLDNQFPGGRKNVRTLAIKTANSKSVPIFLDLDYIAEVPIPDLTEYHEEPEPEEIDTVAGAKLKVYPDGRVKLIRKNKSNDNDEESSEDEDDRLTEQLIARDEAYEAKGGRRKRLVGLPGNSSKKKRRPLLDAFAEMKEVKDENA